MIPVRCRTISWSSTPKTPRFASRERERGSEGYRDVLNSAFRPRNRVRDVVALVRCMVRDHDENCAFRKGLSPTSQFLLFDLPEDCRFSLTGFPWTMRVVQQVAERNRRFWYRDSQRNFEEVKRRTRVLVEDSRHSVGYKRGSSDS